MSKVTYYLGAGASYYSMPLLNGIEERLKIYEDYIFHLNREKLLLPSSENYLKDLSSLINNINESTSIDNYANELFNNQKHVELKKLKHIISGFFLFEQLKKNNTLYTQHVEPDLGIPPYYIPYSDTINKLVKTQFDKRYRTFFNNYFDQTTDRLPSKINIISWNYDLQIEGSYCRAKSCSLDLAQTNLNINPSPHYRESDNVSEIIKLNGTAGIFVSNDLKYSNHIANFNENLIDVLKTNISLTYNNGDSYSLSFAFEHKKTFNNIKKRATKIIANTDILVIIGYSFPQMNNEIDKSILSDTGNISKIYIQIPQNDFDRVIRNIKRCGLFFAESVEHINDVYEFHIP